MAIPKDLLAGQNLTALRKRYPQYADVLSVIDEGTRYSFEVHENAVLCRDDVGKWLHGPTDPRVYAKAEAERAVTDSAELYILLRPGLGYLALALEEAIERRSPDSVLLVVEDRLELFRAALALVNWVHLFQSSRAVLLLGRPDVVIEAFLERHPKLALLPPTIVAAPETSNPGECEALMEALPTMAEKQKAAEEEEVSCLEHRLAVRRTNHKEPRVLIAVEDLGYLAQAIADGFRACGCEVELHPADKRIPLEIRARERFRQMAPVVPDLILWANRPELYPFASEAWRTLGVANALWTMDSPPRLSLGSRELGAIDLHVCFDPTYLPGCEQFGARSAAQLSVAAGLRPLPGSGPSDAKWPERLGPDIAFVGSLGDARVSAVREELWSEQPAYARYLDTLAKQPGDPSTAYEKKTGQPYAGIPCFYVDEVRSAIRRIEVLSRLPRSSLKIFGGSDWVGEESPFIANYGGPVRYGPDLAHIYYHARVNINVFHAQCIDSTNSRVYDVLAAGGFLLSEDRPALHREFEVGRHLVTFSTPEQAAEKAAYYLAHPAERDDIARAGQQHVLAHHTFAERSKRLLDLAKPFIGRA